MCVCVWVSLCVLILCCSTFDTVSPCCSSSFQLRYGTRWDRQIGRAYHTPLRLDLFEGETITQVKMRLYYVLVNHCPANHLYFFSYRPYHCTLHNCFTIITMHNNLNITGVWKIPPIQLHLSVDFWDKQRTLSHRRPASSGSLSFIYFSVHYKFYLKMT